MRTDDLITMLATGAGPVRKPGDGAWLRAGLPLAWGLAAAVVALWLGFRPPDLWPTSATAQKLVLGAVMAVSGLALLRRSCRPGMSLAWPLVMLGAVLLAVVATAMADLWLVPAPARLAHLLGSSARQCPVAIAVLSVPALAVMISAARDLAPTRPRLTGFAAGLAAGGVATLAYSLACPEGALAFVAVWYSLGIVAAGGIGALVAPPMLHW